MRSLRLASVSIEFHKCVATSANLRFLRRTETGALLWTSDSLLTVSTVTVDAIAELLFAIESVIESTVVLLRNTLVLISSSWAVVSLRSFLRLGSAIRLSLRSSVIAVLLNTIGRSLSLIASSLRSSFKCRSGWLIFLSGSLLSIRSLGLVRLLLGSAIGLSLRSSVVGSLLLSLTVASLLGLGWGSIASSLTVFRTGMAAVAGHFFFLSLATEAALTISIAISITVAVNVCFILIFLRRAVVIERFDLDGFLDDKAGLVTVVVAVVADVLVDGFELVISIILNRLSLVSSVQDNSGSVLKLNITSVLILDLFACRGVNVDVSKLDLAAGKVRVGSDGFVVLSEFLA